MASVTHQLLVTGGGAILGASTTYASFDPATAANATVSGQGTIVQNTGTGTVSQGAHVLTSSGKTTGKFYYEATWTSQNIPGGSVGLCGIGTTASTFTAMENNGTTGVILFVPASGQIWSVGGIPATLGTRSVGNVIGIAADITNRLIWMRLVSPSVGNWNGSGTDNPATTTGGVTIPAGTMIPFCTFGGGSMNPGNVVTTNFGDTAFIGTVPTGFTSGWLI